MSTTGKILLLRPDEAEVPARLVHKRKHQETGFRVSSHRLDTLDKIPTGTQLIIVDLEGAEISRADLDFCRQLRARTTHPILLLTNDRDEAHFLQAYQAGVDDCIAKPIGNELLMAKANAWIHFSRQRSS